MGTPPKPLSDGKQAILPVVVELSYLPINFPDCVYAFEKIALPRPLEFVGRRNAWTRKMIGS